MRLPPCKFCVPVMLLMVALVGGAAHADETGKKAGKTDDWANAYCPHAMPMPSQDPTPDIPTLHAFHNPYLDQFKNAVQQGQDAKAEHMERKARHYNVCIDWTYTTAGMLINAPKSYRAAIAIGSDFAPYYSEAAVRQRTLAEEEADKGMIKYDIISHVVTLVYSKMGEQPVKQALESITRETFCTCLTAPTQRVLEEADD